MSESAEYKAAKLTRRNAKASLTRSGRALLHRITNQRSVDEVQETFANVEKVYDDLVQKHEKFTELIEEDEAIEVEEHWLEEYQRQFLDLESRAKEYVQETLNDKGSSETADNEQGAITVDDETTENENTNVEEICSGTQVETPHNQNNEQAGQDSSAQDNTSEICGFKIEKPKMPRFNGDVRDYAIFKSDFKHIIGTKYNNRDAITLLRSALTGKPLEMIKGIGLDYSAAWDYLDSVYGDLRFVADTVIQDIMKFKPLRNEEDSRFCELVYLIRRSYNTLKEVGRIWTTIIFWQL